MALAERRGEEVIVDDLTVLLEDLPPRIRDSLLRQPRGTDLLEVVLDLGREPEARYPGSELVLSEEPVGDEDLQYVVTHVGSFGDDNRAGIERTLHRISAIRNRAGRIVGLTVRVGRAVFGTVAIIRDIVESGRSILLLGRPGVGKTTMLRETARVLADDLGKRVIVVDTSNEIAGDGDIPHPAIGKARRMQVRSPSFQHHVMIEAVENHMPEVIVIDEIGTELEAAAARTIAERGVQLVATAHGNTLENLIMNPTLADLIGGIQTVTLGDEEARRRGTQKSVLERKAPPTFDVLVEIQDWERVAVHENVAQVVDAILRGEPVSPTLRYRDDDGEIRVTRGEPQRFSSVPSNRDRPQPHRGDTSRRNDSWSFGGESDAFTPRATEIELPEAPWPPTPGPSAPRLSAPRSPAPGSPAPGSTEERRRPVRVYAYGVNRTRLEHAIRQQRAPAMVVLDVDQADVVMTVKNYYRRKPQPLLDAEARGIPVYVLRSNTGAQIDEGITKLGRTPRSEMNTEAIQEAEDAIHRVLNRDDPSVELTPQNSYLRRLQHQMADRYNVGSRSVGQEPHRRVTILPVDRS
ncbi:MAG: AAA family ATPase [Chloroflexi bacterium]|nr:AAA family ATPase [Chloroflexota bacterium]